MSSPEKKPQPAGSFISDIQELRRRARMRFVREPVPLTAPLQAGADCRAPKSPQ